MVMLRLLGVLELVGEDGSSIRSVLDQPKRFAVLSYLAASPSSADRRRDTLLGLFWPELDERRARKALRQCLYELRHSLGPRVLTGKGSQLVGVDPQHLQCDVAGFRAAMDAGRLEEALELYQGPFLDGFHLSGSPSFERWVETRRGRLREGAVQAAWDLSDRAEGRVDGRAARRWAERALELAPYDGEGMRRFLSLMDRLGQPAVAVRMYEAFHDRLAADLDLEPSAETTSLVDRLREAGEKARPSPATKAPSPQGAPESGVRENDRTGGSGPAEVPAGAARLASTSRRERPAARLVGIGLALAALVAASLTVFDGIRAGEGTSSLRSLAVLPLTNLSGDPEQDYLANGMTEALISELSQIEALRVISRTSAMTYQGTRKRSPEIASELGVEGLIEGSVVRSGDRIRVDLRLVHGPTDRPLWSQTYERSFRSLLEIQAEVARAIAQAVHAEISAGEGRRLDERPTDEPDAYARYLRGNDYLRQQSRKDWQLAEQMYGQAVRIDPGFARAWERLVYVRSLQVGSRYDSVKLAAATQALNHLRELGPDLDETHAAEGWHALWARADAEAASREFEILRQRRPRNPETLWALGTVRRFAGNQEGAAAVLEELIEFDPRNPEVAATLAEIYWDLRRFDEAERYVSLALSLAPDHHFSYVTKWRILALGFGDTARAARVVEEAEGRVRREELAWLKGIVAEFRRDFPAAIEGFRSWPMPARNKYHYVSRLAARTGNAELARVYTDSLEMMATDRLRRAISRGNVPQVSVARYELAKVHALRGHSDRAVQLGESALRLVPLDSLGPAPVFARTLVWIYGRTGRPDRAVELLERLLDVPGGETLHSLRLNPVYDALRLHPGFQALLRKENERAHRSVVNSGGQP